MCIRLATVLALATAALGQNYDHPGLVYAGKAGWVTPAKARELGYLEYHGRWLPGKLGSKLARWERADKRVKGWGDAYKDKTKHYRIVTDVPRHLLELEIKPYLDELYRTYVDVFKKDFGLTGRAANKKLIKIFHGFENYSRNAELGEIIRRDFTGFTTRGGAELIVYYDETHPGEFYATAFHEGAHQFMFAMLPGAALPTWLDEALATYFEGCTYSRATKKIAVNYLPPQRVKDAQALLRKVTPTEGTSLPEKLFMNVHGDDFVADHYALAWSFVYYLTHCEDGKHKKAFMKFLRATNGAGARPIAEIFKRSTGMNLKDLEGGWRDYVLAMKAPPLPQWILLDVEGDGVDLKTDDRLYSIDGVEITTAALFQQHWTKRKKDAPSQWIVIRRTPVGGHIEFTEKIVRVSVPANSPVVIEDGGTWDRIPNLRD